MNDAQIRDLMIQAIPTLEPGKLEVSLMDYDRLAGFWYRSDEGVLRGSVIALHKTEKEIAAELASDLSDMIIRQNVQMSPYEGRSGRHPDNCTCSKHLKAVDGQAQ